MFSRLAGYVKSVLDFAVTVISNRDKSLVDQVRSAGDRLLALHIKAAKAKLIAAIVSKVPFLAGGPLGFILSFIVGQAVSWALSKLYTKTEDGIIWFGVEYRVDGETRRYLEAEERLENANTKEERDAAEKEADDAFDDFVDLN